MNDDEILKALTEAYAKNGIALVLGAGISRNSNIPSWWELLEKMVREHVQGADERTFTQLTQNNLSLLVIASLLEEQCGSRFDFVEAVRRTLYGDFPFRGRAVNKYNNGEFVRFVRSGKVEEAYQKTDVHYTPNQSLRGVGALCVVRRQELNGKGKPVWRNFANPKVRAIATLNMDALLQTYVSAFSTKHLLRTVERPSAEPYPQEINLYHMHGYLHFAPAKKAHRRDSTEAVVLTEQDYFDFFNQPNSMFNYTFLHLLREYPCLFIGLSMQDENIRRLLHYSKLERMRALAKKLGTTTEKLGKKQDLMEKEIRRHFAILPRNQEPHVNTANRQTLNALGVKVVWVDSFSEIRDLLQKLYESSLEDRDHWAEVYGREQG